jgi:HlyD family secretion protein
MTQKSAAQVSIRRHIFAGIVVIGVLVAGFGGWAGTTSLSGALIAPGSIVVDSNVKKVQHPTGGIVGEVRVREGDSVKLGDVVVRLDDTVTRANLSIVTKGLNELYARKARLEAERDGAAKIEFPAALLDAASDPEVRKTMDAENKLFELRRTTRAGQKSQLRQRVVQLEEEITGHAAQRNAKQKEVELIERELAGVRDLFAKNLIQMNRLTQLEREATRLEGERGLLVATTAQAKGKINELELQIIQIDQELSSEVAKEMRDVDAKIGEFVERKVTAEDQLRRIEIRAPQDGTVFQLNVHTVGGVISAGDAIMLIVPAADNLTVEAKVNPQDINQLQIGQKAILRFTSFNQQSTPEINGTVSRISADITTDQRTGLGYYTIRIALSAEEVARLGEVRLVPGMPVEAFVQTGDRTVISYLMKPLKDHFQRAFREK